MKTSRTCLGPGGWQARSRRSLWRSIPAARCMPMRPLAQAAPQASIVAMRRLTEAQYRNTIADIFGPDIRVAGRFEPIVRPAHELIASGARDASISPAGLEQFDAMARVIAAQVFDEAHRGQFVPCAPKDANSCRRGLRRRRAGPARPLPVPPPADRRASRRSMSSWRAMPPRRRARSTRVWSWRLRRCWSRPISSTWSRRPSPIQPIPAQLRLDNWSRAARLSFMLWNSDAQRGAAPGRRRPAS